MNKTKILICGAGSIGIYLGTLLRAQNHEVTLFGKRKLESIGDEIFINNKIFSVPKKSFALPKNKTYDVIFITTKLYSLDFLIKNIKENNLTSPIIVSIQNGLVDNSRYETLLQGQRLIILSVFEGFRLLENQLIVTPTDMGWKVEHSPEGKRISHLLISAGIVCTAEPLLDRYRAEKSIINCCLNVLSAIEKKPFSVMFSEQGIEERINKIFDECYTLLSQERTLDDKEVLRARMYKTWSHMNHYSSTCQDVISGRKTEIDFLNGYMVQLGNKHGIPAVENQKVVDDFGKMK